MERLLMQMDQIKLDQKEKHKMITQLQNTIRVQNTDIATLQIQLKAYKERRDIELIKLLSTPLASLQKEMEEAIVDVREIKRTKLNTCLITLETLLQQIDVLETQGNHYEERSIHLLENATAAHLDNICCDVPINT